MHILHKFFEISIVAFLIVLFRRLIINLNKDKRNGFLSRGFNASQTLMWGSLFFTYLFTHNITVTLIAFFSTIVLRFIYFKLFFMFPNDHPINDLSLLLWSLLILYLIHDHNKLNFNIDMRR